ncbi:hypothetical protein ASPVEDRAFT_33932 [Aspergillus versicolor CBS 583.65]|uniref:Uncharacterized protein n=1 Tax=Aspergillus versicolor CBS 583.65 TaxID=1036611 RepID=A0A1L9Q1W9_ASPVE|nr:uncharacterized protein ASPVEDRAFT_33932 [Aspergillus versicolor CBS 583.65]OJJ07738.1 hypothetical protein ASPVEDRAFT_33932 [Aspergillus versicolor CBS 583.65]
MLLSVITAASRIPDEARLTTSRSLGPEDVAYRPIGSSRIIMLRGDMYIAQAAFMQGLRRSPPDPQLKCTVGVLSHARCSAQYGQHRAAGRGNGNAIQTMWVDQGVRLNADHDYNRLAQSAFSGILRLAVLRRAKEQSTVNGRAGLAFTVED